MKRIDFFIVGAPKCGTTALYSYLAQHPGVFVPDTLAENRGKIENHHFSPEYAGPNNRFATRDNFLAPYASASPEAVWGDASVYNLYPPEAPERIFQYNPDAKIIIMLRDPADFLLSYHREMIYLGAETIRDPLEAIRGSFGRPALCQPSVEDRLLDYATLANFSAPVQRFIDRFGSGQVLVIPFESFFTDPTAGTRRVFGFLGLPDTTATMHFGRVNPAKSLRFPAIHKLLRRPPAWITRPLKRVIPSQDARNRISQVLVSLNARCNIRQTVPCAPASGQASPRQALRELLPPFAPVPGIDLGIWNS